ncbi:MAG: hypothetical protein WC314_13985 [Vulcanimicrobiota bacterium]
MFFILLLLASQAGAEMDLPEGWDFYASRPGLYAGGRNTEGAFSGQASGVLRSRQHATAKEHALLVQKLSAEEYRGFRMELSGSLKTSEVSGWAGLWVRVDDVDGNVLEFHNMMDTPVRGTTGWTRHTVSFDVPAEAFEIHFGALLAGEGEMGVDSLLLRRLGGTRPASTLKQKIRSLPLQPRNLDFEQ